MSRKQYDYSQLEGARQNLQNRAMDKIQNYDKVKQGVSAFNKANEQGNLIKDAMGTGIDLVKDATIEGGIAFAKKGIEGIASKVADYSDAFKGTEGGLEGLDKRITSRFTSIQRAKLRNAQNTRQNTRSTQAEPEAEPEAEPGAEPAAEPTAEPAEPLDENPFSFENAGGLNEADSTTTFGDISDTQLKQRLIQTEDPVDAVQAQDEIDYRAKRANPDAEEGGGDAAADAGDAAEGGGDAAAAAGGDAAAVGGDAAAGAGEGLIEGAATVGAEAFGDIAAEGALTLLDATGIGAIIGVPLQIATGVGAVVGAVDVGEHLWKDFTDLFKGGNKSGDESAPAAPTFSTKLIAPTLES
tara:strand:- start:609 stop:1673 length:1065 start_codon:yes stop_codon:yes gene_type:complete